MEFVEEAREDFLNSCLRREENLDGRESTRTARSAEGARAWSDPFVGDILPHGTGSRDEASSSPHSAEVDNSAGVGTKEGVQNNAGVSSSAGTLNSVGVHNSASMQQHPVIMAAPKEKLPKFDGEDTVDPIRHCKTCVTIWRANGIMDTNEWVR